MSRCGRSYPPPLLQSWVGLPFSAGAWTRQSGSGVPAPDVPLCDARINRSEKGLDKPELAIEIYDNNNDNYIVREE